MAFLNKNNMVRQVHVLGIASLLFFTLSYVHTFA